MNAESLLNELKAQEDSQITPIYHDQETCNEIKKSRLVSGFLHAGILIALTIFLIITLFNHSNLKSEIADLRKQQVTVIALCSGK